MIMKKKLAALLLIFALTFAFCALTSCNDDENLYEGEPVTTASSEEESTSKAEETTAQSGNENNNGGDNGNTNDEENEVFTTKAY